jgi:glycosyltransferase involved in cell wall biosynthesis
MRLVPKKRPLVLPRVLVAARAAARAAAPATTSVRLVVAGAGSSREALERAAARCGVADALTCVGWQPRAALRALYRDADAFVLPTRRESFGIAALEARAAGLPVLGMAGTGLADFVRDGAEGVLCADDAALGRAAARLATDAPWRAALGARSAACVPHAFDWSAVLARHEAAYAGDAG